VKIAFKIIIFLLLVLLAGCQSLQQDKLYTSSADEKILTGLAEQIIPLDNNPSKNEINAARKKITELEKSKIKDRNFEGRLAAWSGRLFIMEGRNSDAQREFQRSQSLSPLNLPSQVLSFRLERDPSRRLNMIETRLSIEGSRGELLTESGRVLFDMNRFSEAVAAFDSAFIALREKPYYEEAYGQFRTKAWELRELEQDTGGRTVEIARQGEITWFNLIEITRTETDFLRFITAGRDWPVETLFTQLLERSFIPLTQDTSLSVWPNTNPSSGELVLRSGAAWFLWHLNAQNRSNRGLLTRYSSRLTSIPNARSPIPDLDVWSPFIDSILGCVESEFMSLPDGRNFNPDERVRGSDFLSMLLRLRP